MKVSKICAGCDHCEYSIYDDYGCYDPGYYCDLNDCADDYNMMDDDEVDE